jgi:hypothetical protein
MDGSRDMVFELVLNLLITREEQRAEITRISKELGSFELFGSFWYPFGSLFPV